VRSTPASKKDLRNTRKRSVRPRVIQLRRITRAEMELGARLYPPIDVERPRVRGDCVGDPRPCPFVGCRHHLYLDVTHTGGIRLNFPDLEPWELESSCSLDVAAERARSGEKVGALLNITRERVRQIEDAALLKIEPILLPMGQ
jgi:hypothetical protein